MCFSLIAHAALLDHKSAALIHKHYSHVASKAKTLNVHLQHIGKVNGEVTATTANAEVRTTLVANAGSVAASSAA